jgi:hypothetical protein
MDTLHTVLRSLRGETKNDRAHLDVFREFLAHLDKLSRTAPARPSRGKPGAPRKTARRAGKA